MAPLIIGRGREADVLQLLAPFRDGSPVGPGATLNDIAIVSDKITLTVVGPASQTAHIVLHPQSGGRSFDVQVPQPVDPALEPAVAALTSAIARNDHGTFFAAPAAVAAVPSVGIGNQPVVHPSADSGAQSAVSAALWVVLAAAVAAKALRKPHSWSAGVFGAILLVLAATARRNAPFTPLHADDHAYMDLAVGLKLPQAEDRAAQLMHDYGPAWWQLQRWTAPLWGDDHAALGRWAAAVGALATVLAVLAARRASGRWLPAFVGGAAMCWAPLAVRVGHSESNVVVAQLLVAAALWLASPPYPARSGAYDAVGVLAAVGLLAWGHPLGPAFAVGTGLCAWALAVRPESLQAAVAVPLEPMLALPNPHPRRIWMPARHNLWLLGIGLAVAAAAIGWQWQNQQGLLGNRLAATSLVPVPLHFWTFGLWWQRAWGAVTLTTVVAVAGVLGLWSQRRVHGAAVAWWSAAAWMAGMGALGVAGLVVVACVTDAVRYQAPMAAAWVVLAAFAPRCADLFSGIRRSLVGLTVVAAMGIAVVEAWLTPWGATALDAQGQAYQVLAQELAHERGDLWLIVPERAPGERRHVVVDLPTGRFDHVGSTLHRISANEYAQACIQGRAPTPAWVYLSPACEAVDLAELPTPCAALAPLLDPTVLVRAGYVRPWLGDMAQGLPGEFHHYRSETVAWHLGRAVCPAH